MARDAGIEAFGGAFFRPNVLALARSEGGERREETRRVLEIGRREEVGVTLLIEAARRSPCKRDSVNVWFPDRGAGWELGMELENQDLAEPARLSDAERLGSPCLVTQNSGKESALA